MKKNVKKKNTYQDSCTDLTERIKNFTNKQKLREFSTIKPTARQMLKKLL